MEISNKTKELIKQIIIATLTAILTWLGATACTNILSIQKHTADSEQKIEADTKGEAKADSTSINLLNKE